jgi:hypothetical protein
VAITRPRRPVVLIIGKVLGKLPRAKYNDNGQSTGEVARYDVTILQANYATPDVRFPIGVPDAVRVPEEGEEVALIVDLGETDQYGANLRIVRYATDDDLESIGRKIPALAGK